MNTSNNLLPFTLCGIARVTVRLNSINIWVLHHFDHPILDHLTFLTSVHIRYIISLATVPTGVQVSANDVKANCLELAY